MLPSRSAQAQSAVPKRFFALFYPNGRDPRNWDPAAGALNAAALPESLRDLNGFAAEAIWPAGTSIVANTAVVSGIKHSAVAKEIHIPCMALMAHVPGSTNATASAPSLDQHIANHIKGETPYRTLTLAATPSTDIAQGHISWRAAGQVETVERDPAQLFSKLFASSMPTDTAAAERARLRKRSVLDYVLEDAKRLNMRLGSADKQRLDQYLQSISELEKQVGAAPGGSCKAPAAPTAKGDWHTKTKAFIDLAVVALSCDMSRVVTLQYSDSWGVHYGGYTLGAGKEALGTWSDHFISHKLGDADRATDLDGLDPTEARRIADARVLMTSRFKVRRFGYLVNALKQVTTPTGTLLDDTLAMLVSENGDGDSHSRDNMGTLLAGGVLGGSQGKAFAAKGAPTGALHGAVMNKFGMNVTSHGDPAAPPLAGL
ncbi:MAG TPA: DUF1552 domain-containing protein [Polyangiales bacterium]